MELKLEANKWYNCNEIMPDPNWIRMFYDEHDMLPEFLVHIEGYPLPTACALNFDLQWEFAESDSLVDKPIDYWMLMPSYFPGDAKIFDNYKVHVEEVDDILCNDYSFCKIAKIN